MEFFIFFGLLILVWLLGYVAGVYSSSEEEREKNERFLDACGELSIAWGEFCLALFSNISRIVRRVCGNNRKPD